MMMRRPILSKVLPLVLLMISGCSGWRVGEISVHPECDWLMNGRDASRTWNAPGPVPPPLKLLWKYDASAATGSPVVADSILFTGTYRGELHAVTVAGGERIGRLSLEGPLHGTPLLDGSMLIAALASGENTLLAIDVPTGDVVWNKKLGPIETSPVCHDRRLYVAAEDGTVYCLDKENGEELWKYSLPDKKQGSRIRSSPATNGRVLVFGCDDGTFVALDANSGTLRWEVQTKASIFGSPAISKDRVIVGSTDGVLYALNTGDGSICWKSDFGGTIYSSPAVTESTVVIGAANGRIRALSVTSGVQLWEYRAASVVSVAAVISNGVAYVGTLDRYLYAFDIHNGNILWKTRVEGRIRRPPVIWGGFVFVPVEDKFIYAFTSE